MSNPDYPFDAEWRAWMQAIFPEFTAFAPHHERFWHWVWDMQPGVRPRPFIGIWPRGGGKSSSAELATVAIGATDRRKYGLYVSGTQQQAEKHLLSIEALLGSPGVEQRYPAMANRDVNKYGSSRGWRRDRLVTASGFVIDAVGLKTGTRGVKFEDQRPDFIVFDDVDELDDTDETTQRKIHTLTQTLLPAGSNDLATLGIQNLIIPNGLFARLAPHSEDPADFLRDRIVSGPVAAVDDLEYEEREDEVSGQYRVYVTGGIPAWGGQDLATVEFQLNDWGVAAFLSEAQHDVRQHGAKVFRAEWWHLKNRYRSDDPRISLVTERYLSFDTAETTAKLSARTACVVGDILPSIARSVTSGHLAIRDVEADQMEFPDLVAFAYDMIERWHDDRLHQLTVLIEMASSGRQLMQVLQRERDRLPRNVRLVPVKVKGSKESRALIAGRSSQESRVLLPETIDAPQWVPGFLRLLTEFPESRHKDEVDAFSQLAGHVQPHIQSPQQTGAQAA